MGCFSRKTLYYICAALNLVGNLLGTAISITFCVWYKDDSRALENLESGLTETPFWIYVVLSIAFVFSIPGTISLIRGIHQENNRMIAAFFSSSNWVILILLIRAFVLVSRHNDANHSSSSVAADFFRDIGYVLFVIVTSMPFYISYNYECCCGSGQKHTAVSQSDV